MAQKIIKTATTLLAATLLVGTAHAGGFDRGTADTDILFEDGNFVTRFGVGYVMPTQNQNAGGTDLGSPVQNYVIPNFAMKLGVTESSDCAATYTTPFGGSVDFSDAPGGADPTSTIGAVKQEFVTNELGLTCSYKVDAGRGNFRILGGVFMQTLDFEQDFANQGVTTGFLPAANLSLQDQGIGWRAGVAYEIPEIALRAQLLYRSAVAVSATGQTTALLPTPTTIPGVGTVILPAGTVVFDSATGDATFPQSVEAKFQTGVAPGWLVFGGVKWTDWSVFEVLEYNATGEAATLNFFWKDGWTINAGVARRFSEQLAATASFRWDRGVSTGHDINETTWGVAVGTSYTPNENAELRLGASYTYIESGSQDFTAGAPGDPQFVSTPGVKTASSGHAVGVGLSLKAKF
ncbi:MAG: outer membrane protein transport protein [Pseudomonadota bacterium]